MKNYPPEPPPVPPTVAANGETKQLRLRKSPMTGDKSYRRPAVDGTRRLFSCFFNLLFYYFLLNFTGCATVSNTPILKPPSGIDGLSHRVKKGETLWKISRIYDVSIEELIKLNSIDDKFSIEIGQLIFIPKRVNKQPDFYHLNLEDFSWPVEGKIIGRFGETVNDMINKGINIQPVNNAKVYAARSGRVVFYNPDFKNFGKVLIIEHGDGFSTVYARNSEVFVKIGDAVGKGTAIAKVGSAGRDKTKYLHFEIRKRYFPQNPYFYLPKLYSPKAER